jgi:hypothetical protein
VTLLWGFTHVDPRRCWDVFVGGAPAGEASGLARVGFVASVIATLTGSDTYVDELRRACAAL